MILFNILSGAAAILLHGAMLLCKPMRSQYLRIQLDKSEVTEEGAKMLDRLVKSLDLSDFMMLVYMKDCLGATLLFMKWCKLVDDMTTVDF